VGGILLLLYLLGPVPPKPNIDTTLPQTPEDLIQLEKEVNRTEEQVVTIKRELFGSIRSPSRERRLA
jgi:hypothetical protein